MVWAVPEGDAPARLASRCPPRFRRRFDPHVTLAYGVEAAEYERAHPGTLGWTGTIRVSGCAADDRVQAAVVDLTGTPLVSSNAHPHITISAADGVAPVESNRLLAAEHTMERLEPPLDIAVRVVFLPFR